MCFQAANDCDLEPVAYEFFTQAYILYEEEITVTFSLSFSFDHVNLLVGLKHLSRLIVSPLPELFLQDSKAQVTSIHLIIGTLQRMHVFGVENRDALTHKATGVNFCKLI